MASWLYQADVALGLTIVGNEYLKAYQAGRAWSASSFDFGDHVWFVTRTDARPDGKARVRPESWIAEVCDHGIRGFGLHHVQSPSASFDEPGNGQWFIEATKGSVSDFWEGALSLDRGTDLVTTYSWSSNGPSGFERGDVSSARADIEGTLQEITEYAERNGLGHFNLAFDQALANLHAKRPPTDVIYTDFKWDFGNCEALTLDAKQLVAAARSAWGVFGSMGAWNDLPMHERSEEYIRLTQRLGRVLVQSFIVAANNSAQSASS